MILSPVICTNIVILRLTTEQLVAKHILLLGLCNACIVQCQVLEKFVS